jgi:isopentenyl diphosphate isomerase/L-lactate dehydrogenase-like FMN-dependent dehydrogenase
MIMLQAGQETKLQFISNRNVFEQWRILPRLLKGVSNRSLYVNLFGYLYPFPVSFVSTACQGHFYRQGEIAVAKAAATMETPIS